MQAKNNWNGMMKIAAALLCVMMAGCQIGDNNVNVSDNNTTSGSGGSGGSENGGQQQSDVDYTDYAAGDYVIKVTNNTAKKLVAFKGTPSISTLMGGIPATSANFGLKRDASMFGSSTDFVLFLITEEDYIAKKDSLTTLATVPFARLYAYYNSNAKNNIVYQISSKMGGAAKLTLNNNTGFNIELRKDGIYGETLGYAGAETLNTVFSLEYGDYYIFPVFRKFDTTINEIVTVYPKYSGFTGAAAAANGKALVEVLNFSQENPNRSINTANWKTNSDYVFSSGYAYIRITNSSNTDISLYNGANSAPLVTSTGFSLVPSGATKTFTLQMEINSKNSATGSIEYQEFKTYSQFFVGNALTSNVYLTGGADVTADYYGGKIYDYTIVGTTAYDLRVSSTTPVVSDMTW